MSAMAPSYLGDAVYASHDGYHLILTTGHHLPAAASNTIALEPEVIQALLDYVERLKAHLQKERAAAQAPTS